ncbi:MAG: hypothetical protein WCB46_11405 [Methanoregula sp.]
MRKKFHVISVILFIILVLGSVAVTSAAAKEQKPVEEIKLTAEKPVANAQFGRSVAIDGDLVAVGEGGDGAVGAVYLYKRQGQMYVPDAKLESPDPLPETCTGIPGTTGTCPEFGRTVAIQGNTVFVGARFAPVAGLNAGAVYVFRKHSDVWQVEDKIVSPSPQNEDNFGRALAIQGNVLVVTARKEKLGAMDVGAAYVFAYKDGGWKFQTKLTASDPAPGAYFGQSVALQGNLIAIGARNADPNGAGAVYLFRNSGEDWTQVARVAPSDGKTDDQYGFTVAISGNTMTVGSRRADPDGLTDAGAVYVYSLKRDSADLVTRLTPGDARAGDEFGQSVAFAGDVIAVGAWKDDIGDSADQGSVYLFRRAGGQWAETGKITATDGVAGDEFGYSLAAFGDRMVTGAHFADAKAGVAYVLPAKPLH